jgi:hypothetical protein
MRYLIIEDGIVTNAAAATEPLGDNWVQSDTGAIGDLYDGETFTAPPTPQEEIDAAWKALRSRRDGLLANTDWTQLPDAPTNAAAWQVYRQALRDLPTKTTDPFNVQWPEPPVFAT